MTSKSLKPRRVSLKSAFGKRYDKNHTPPDHLPEPFESNDKPQRDANSSRRTSNRVSKHQASEKHNSPSSILADGFAASLDQYRNDIHNSVSKDLDDVEKEMCTSLADLTNDLDDHIERLLKVEEPLQKPFNTETLSICTNPAGEHGEGKQQEVLLQDRMDDFRKLREDKEKTLCRLWDEWEDIQFQLVGLAAEVLGPDMLTFAQTSEEDMKPGQKGRLQDALRLAQNGPPDKDNQHESLEQDLEVFHEEMNQITTKTKRTVTEMQQVGVSRPFGDNLYTDQAAQQYTVQKNKLCKGLHRHIELLAAL
ncbi:hypothetical protein EDD36DRAFT_134376 [Exophiala viscosa]|uniref:Uncharacterized protein n=1 Tax=Exophiala viscosa TaxID=2486360 RepID=A0AAN6E1X3_9EURO|nr:hypothetical protein EDD36DRAFT_134376 [Exophiala viscosa]